MPWRRRLWRVPAVAGWVVLGLLLASLLQLIPMRWRTGPRQSLTSWWMRRLLRLLPLRIRCHGQPTRESALWVGNHVSWLDIILLGAQAPVRFVAKAEVRQWPLLGWLAHSAGTLFLRRGQASGENASQQMAAVLERGQSLVLFAEGTTTAGDQVRTFHGRLLGWAAECKVPIQPVAVAYRRHGRVDTIAPFIDDDEFSRHLWRLLGSATIDVQLHFPPLIDSHGLERNQLARRARHAVVQALGLEDSSDRQSAASLSAAA
ncbi:1-acyl-sn-glycerol-3-phosphate acyltransferase [Pseudomonas sp. MYb185]|uniref:lysophospholipid acyltransferase family protein n=1 Tax=Pseudomonas sp. MYb185 TaxID=1848729 RepID=UPI000CFACA5A|nr:lysophospholipid acyltransferase family protein [Pseudomonas sp. MYb185]PRB83766.1 1-acyl-sn-glycerol-3-phosphate acyltransferase [Pseudomonas sp. MYb185]